MSEGAVQTTEPNVMSEPCDNARDAILNAARFVAERDGVKHLTLDKVAAEAEVPRPLLLNQFARKKDLLLYVAADSLATVARSIVDIDWTAEEARIDDAREGAVILTLPRRDVATETDNSSGAPVSEFIEKIATSAPYSWLERRLRQFEGAIADLVTRQTQGEKDSRAVLDEAEDETRALRKELRELAASSQASIRALQENLRALESRVAASETRQTETVNDVRAALNETNLRVQTVEGVAHAALVENQPVQVELPPLAPPPALEVPGVDVPALEMPAVAMGEMPVTEEDEPKLESSYLSAARASAIAAAATKISDEDRHIKADSPKQRAHEFVAVIAVLAVSVAAAFSLSLWNVRARADDHVARQAPHAVILAAADTPLDRLAQRAEAGDAASELAVAFKYLNGTVSARDPVAGLRWMNRAAKHGAAVAQFMLGYLYEKGGASAADPVQAMRWYEAAALQGNRKAMHNLAVAYARGLGGAKSPTEAVRWFSRAASFGYVDSQFDLAVLYERGEGAPQSLINAYKWYAIAGAQGDAESRARIEALRTQLPLDDVAAAQHAADAFRALPFDAAANLPPKV